MSRWRKRATRSKSKPANASRNASRLPSIVRHARPDWKPSRQIFSKRRRSSRTGNSPLAIVIRNVERVLARPPASLDRPLRRLLAHRRRPRPKSRAPAAGRLSRLARIDSHAALLLFALADLQLFLDDRNVRVALRAAAARLLARARYVLRSHLPRSRCAAWLAVAALGLDFGGGQPRCIRVVGLPPALAPLRRALVDVERTVAFHRLDRLVDAALLDAVDHHDASAPPHGLRILAGMLVAAVDAAEESLEESGSVLVAAIPEHIGAHALVDGANVDALFRNRAILELAACRVHLLP